MIPTFTETRRRGYEYPGARVRIGLTMRSDSAPATRMEGSSTDTIAMSLITALAAVTLLAAAAAAQIADVEPVLQAPATPASAPQDPWSQLRERGRYSLMELVPGAPVPERRDRLGDGAGGSDLHAGAGSPPTATDAGEERSAGVGAAMAGLEGPQDWRGRGSYRDHRFDPRPSGAPEPNADRSGQYGWPGRSSLPNADADDIMGWNDHPDSNRGYRYGSAGRLHDEDPDEDWEPDDGQ